MSVLTIRGYKRYAMRLPVEVVQDGRKAASGLLIELSQQGARLSNLLRNEYDVGDQLMLVTPFGKEMPATVRWAHDGVAGVRLDRPLHLPEMSEMVEANRSRDLHSGNETTVRYGT